MNETEVLARAISTFGHLMQIIVAVEEMSELTKELCKAIRGKADMEHIAEEIADVEVMLEQMKLIYNVYPSVEKWRARKVLRLAQRIEEQRRESAVGGGRRWQ
jgi:NTP pyrophosphatase (non-canonical NTP hydrolase)